ncbi:MAG: carboxypeptidase-like regulatory domain-containing protein, partial [Candidatus Thermoplasmatota archaeon]|nr:carboxypeptidase-like regulatory domain-containing protein [Candidatus Thermoplasmatota archaeon]
MTIPETSHPPAKARVIWIAALLLGSGLLLLTAPAWASDGFFEGPHTDAGLDTDADNRFEFLQVNVTVNVTVGGVFTVEGNLYDSLGITFIMHTSTAFSGGVGVHVATLNFEGPAIFESRVDGPYRVTLDLLNDTMASVDGDVHITGPYSHVSFGPIFAFTPPHTDVGLDTDGNALYNFIQVNISANTSLPGFFFVFGGIFSSGIMDFKIQVLNLTAGDHVIPFNFSGVGAFISGNDGPYDVLLSASMVACGQDPGPGDGSSHTTTAFFFTEFESAIKRDLTGSVTDGTTGMPVADETVWLANETHRWLTTFETNATGNFSFVAFEGDFVLMAGADGLQDQAIPITISGDTNVDVALPEEPAGVAEIGITLADWGNLTLDVVRWGYLDNQSQRFMVDQFVGNGDLIADASESQVWADVFFACFPAFNDTTGVFEVDGIGFQLNGTFGMDSDISGPVTSTAPIIMTQDGDYTAKSPVPASSTHQVLVNVAYDSESETEVFTLTLPKAWVLESFWAPINVTVSGLNNNAVT